MERLEEIGRLGSSLRSNSENSFRLDTGTGILFKFGKIAVSKFKSLLLPKGDTFIELVDESIISVGVSNLKSLVLPDGDTSLEFVDSSDESDESDSNLDKLGIEKILDPPLMMFKSDTGFGVLWYFGKIGPSGDTF